LPVCPWYRSTSKLKEGDREQRNAMAAGGYPWTVIPVENRTAYMHALEMASVGEHIAPFWEFVAGLVKKRLTGGPLLPVPKTSP
jgi:hypothetical protein